MLIFRSISRYFSDLMMSGELNIRDELLSKLYGATEYFGQCYGKASDAAVADAIVETLDRLKLEANELPSTCQPKDLEYLRIREEFEAFLRDQGSLKCGIH